eukprot:TCONS_00071725-protein
MGWFKFVLGSFLTLAIFNLFYVEADPKAGIDPSCEYFHNETDPNLVLKTPGFDTGLYPNNKKCGWVIESPEQAAGITIRFKYFDLEPTKRCSKYDYMMLYAQGHGESTWKQLGATDGYCGSHDSINITETTKRVLIVFRSDETKRYKGFNATFTIQITQAKPRITCLSLLENTVDGGNCNRTIEKEEGDYFLVQCKAKAIPPAKYKWEKSNIDATTGVETWAPIADRIVKNTFPNGSIQFHEIEESDLGKYRCHAENKHGEDEEMFSLYVKEKCPCPKNIRMSWYDYPPYTKYQVGTDSHNNAIYKGIFYDVLRKMFDEVCGPCTKGHGPSNLVWDVPKNKAKRLTHVKKEIEDEEADIYFPIEGGKFDDKYRNIFYFVPVVDSPGVAFLVPGIEEGASAMAIFDSVLEGKPILILTVVMALLAGIIMWMLDTYWNEEQFPRKFGEGVAEGFWWAFVTMTTVGYGDIAPVGVPGRLFAVIWILTGLVIIAIFTGVITTSLTVVALSSNVKLYGTKVGAINNTKEYRMGVIKNADMVSTASFDELSRSLSKRDIEGALIDSYVAAYHRDKFGKFRVNNIIQAPKAFGIVLGASLSTKRLYTSFKDYLEKEKADIVKDVERNTETLTEPEQSAAEEASSDLFNPSSKIFVNSVLVSCILLVIFSLFGIGFQYLYLDPRNRMIEAAKNLEMVDSVEVKQMAAQSKMLKEALLSEVRQFYAVWGDRLSVITKRHKEEQKKLLARGPSTPPSRPKAAPVMAPSPQAEEAIEIDHVDEPEPEQQPESSRSTSSAATSLSNKSTTSLIKDDGEDGPPAAPEDPPAEDQTPQDEDKPENENNSDESVSLKDMSQSPDMNGSKISVKPLIEDGSAEESKV